MLPALYPIPLPKDKTRHNRDSTYPFSILLSAVAITIQWDHALPARGSQNVINNPNSYRLFGGVQEVAMGTWLSGLETSGAWRPL